MLSKVDQLFDWVLPPRCLLCHAPQRPGFNRSFCAGCLGDLPWLLPPSEGRVLAALEYEYPIDRLVTAAKFHGRRDCARALGELLAAAVQARHAGPCPQRIVPVPLHRRRLGERGFNQAEDIACEVAAALDRPLDTQLCRRDRATSEQSGLSAVERRRNLRQAFHVTRPVTGEHLAVVDDVITTGSTAAALVRALHAAGAAQVEVWAVAQTPRRRQNGLNQG